MNCKICNREMKCLIKNGKDFFVGNGKGEYQIYYCKRCKLGFTYPQMDQEELKKCYPDTYEAYVSKRKWMNLVQLFKYASDLRMIKKHFKKIPDKICELGAGRGQFLAFARKKWEVKTVHGVELSRTGVQNAYEKYGIMLECKSAEEITFMEKYDLVIMRHILEHLNSFESVIQNIYQNGLKEHGILFLKIPNLCSYEFKKFGRYWDGIDLPRHRVHFTSGGIKKLLYDTGFSQVKIHYEVVPSAYDRSLQ